MGCRLNLIRDDAMTSSCVLAKQLNAMYSVLFKSQRAGSVKLFFRKEKKNPNHPVNESERDSIKYQNLTRQDV